MNRPTRPSDLLNGLLCQEWLICNAEQLADSPSPLDQAASLGVIARLWGPTNRTERERCLAGELQDPSAGAVAWVRGLAEVEVSRLEEQAIAEATRLPLLLEELRRLDPDESEERLKAVQRLMQRRDVLESVAFLLSSIRRAKKLRAALRLVDQDAVASFSFFPTVATFEGNPWLREVARREPDSWWGSFADSERESSAARKSPGPPLFQLEVFRPFERQAEPAVFVARESCAGRSPLPASGGEAILSRTVRAWCRDQVEQLLLRQGRCKVERSVRFAFGAEDPPRDMRQLAVWFRSGWDEPESRILSDIWDVGDSAPWVFVLIPKDSVQDRDRVLARIRDGESSEDSSLLAELRQQLLPRMRVMLAGGREFRAGSLADSLSQALMVALDRLYPRFSEADEPSAHISGPRPVAAAILDYVNTGKRGGELVELFQGPGFGWPLEAIHGAICTLVEDGLLTASYESGKPVEAKNLQAGSLGRVIFRATDYDRQLLLHLLKLAKGLPGTEEIRRELGSSRPMDREVVARLVERVSQLIEEAIGKR